MCMFIDCEQNNLAAVDDHVERIRRLAGPGYPDDVIPDVAVTWSRAWQAELNGNQRLAMVLRQGAVLASHVKGRMEQLIRPIPPNAAFPRGGFQPWTPGEPAEAKLLVDLYTDWIRSFRMCRPPFGPSTVARAQLATLLNTADPHPVRALLRHPEMSELSQRRFFSRLAFEAADRPAFPGLPRLDVVLLLDEAEAALNVPLKAKPPVALLDQPLLEIERELAWCGRNYDRDLIKRLRNEAMNQFDACGFTRRRAHLGSNWHFYLALHSRHMP